MKKLIKFILWCLTPFAKFYNWLIRKKTELSYHRPRNRAERRRLQRAEMKYFAQRLRGPRKIRRKKAKEIAKWRAKQRRIKETIEND